MIKYPQFTGALTDEMNYSYRPLLRSDTREPECATDSLRTCLLVQVNASLFCPLLLMVSSLLLVCVEELK